MQLENPLTFVRSLKGAPASILWAYLFSRKAMTALELQEWTGYKGDNITEAIRFLISAGWLVARSARGPWCLAAGRQLPLMAVHDEKVDLMTRSDSDLIGVGGASSSSSHQSFLDSSIREEQEEEEESDLIGVVAALDAAGIREPVRSRLKKMKHVTPEFIRAHVAKAKKEGCKIGTAIYRIENNWEVDVDEGGDYQTTVDRGKRGQIVVRYEPGLVESVAEFTRHEPMCKCIDCTVARSLGVSALCPECRRYRCECADLEEE